MGKYINKGNDGFASVRNSNFVDKSMLIAQVNSVLMTDNRFLCVTRARRFGNDVPVKLNSLRFSNDMHRIECKDDVLTLLCHLGYLSYNSLTKSASIPNYEVRQEFETAVADTGWAEVMTALQQSEHLLECVLEGEADEVAALVGQVHQQNTSVLRCNNENALACVLSLAFYTARNRYQMVRELPSGKGFADIVLLPLRGVDAPAIVLELKWNQSADTAIAQIKRQEYAGALTAFAGEVLLVGINYNKKTKRHECRIERCKVGTINHPQTTHKRAVGSNTSAFRWRERHPGTYGSGRIQRQAKFPAVSSQRPDNKWSCRDDPS